MLLSQSTLSLAAVMAVLFNFDYVIFFLKESSFICYRREPGVGVVGWWERDEDEKERWLYFEEGERKERCGGLKRVRYALGLLQRWRCIII